jgi:rubrerythrin
MYALNKQIKQFIKLHLDSAQYYRACAEITTEADLVELFNSVAERRSKMSSSLLALFPMQTENELWLLKDVLSYLQHAWYHLKLALVINNREQILQHCHKNEQEMLEEYDRLATIENLSEALFRLCIYHQQLLKENIRQIVGTPVLKFSRQKAMQFALQKRP